MLLNPFEIKAEILSIIEDCKDETNINKLEQRVSKIDSQSDSQTVEKILFKELLHANTSKERIIRFLLQRYVPKDRLIDQLWSVLKNTMTSSEVKIIVLSYLRELETNWKYEDFSEHIGDDIDIIDNDTKNLLETAIVNPEVQIDFLDFLSAVGDKDKVLLVKSLSDDYKEDALANILVPVFLSAPESELGKIALDSLGNSHSQLAYHALNTAYEFLSEKMKPLVRKNLNLLKLSGIREDNSREFYKKILSGSKPYRCCATYPDGQGNQALIFSRKNAVTKRVQFVAVVVNDYTGIRDCFGFNDISEFECDKIIERFYKDEKNIPLKAEALKSLILRGEMISKEKTSNWILPYEYVCWKNLLVDIEADTTDIKSFMDKEFVSKPIIQNEFEQISLMDFMQYWFLDYHYSTEFEAFLDVVDTEVLSQNYNFDSLIDKYVNMIFYPEEYEVWKNKLLVTAYIKHHDNYNDIAQLLYSVYCDKTYYVAFLKIILMRSIYEYYFSLKFNNEEKHNKFTLKQLDDIIEIIEDKWVKNV